MAFIKKLSVMSMLVASRSARIDVNKFFLSHQKDAQEEENVYDLRDTRSLMQEVEAINMSLGEQVTWPSDWKSLLHSEADVVGEGHFAKVYLAKTLGKEMIVAVKELKSASDDTAVQDFQDEAYLLHLLTVTQGSPRFPLYLAQADGYLMMGAALGGDLSKITGSAAIPIETRLRLFYELVEGLEVMHNLGIVHRDVKPTNAMLSLLCESSFGFSPCKTKLADLGLACALNREVNIPRCKKETKGTPYYIAPEVYNENAVGAQNDIWAAGLIFFEVWFGSLPANLQAKSNTAALAMAVVQFDITADPKFIAGGPLPPYFKQVTMPEEFKPLLKGMLANPMVEGHGPRLTATQILAKLREIGVTSGAFGDGQELPQSSNPFGQVPLRPQQKMGRSEDHPTSAGMTSALKHTSSATDANLQHQTGMSGFSSDIARETSSGVESGMSGQRLLDRRSPHKMQHETMMSGFSSDIARETSSASSDADMQMQNGLSMNSQVQSSRMNSTFAREPSVQGLGIQSLDSRMSSTTFERAESELSVVPPEVIGASYAAHVINKDYDIIRKLKIYTPNSNIAVPFLFNPMVVSPDGVMLYGKSSTEQRSLMKSNFPAEIQYGAIILEINGIPYGQVAKDRAKDIRVQKGDKPFHDAFLRELKFRFNNVLTIKFANRRQKPFLPTKPAQKY